MRLVCAPSHPLASRSGLVREDLKVHTEVVVRDSSPRLARSPRPAFLGTPGVIYLADFHTKRQAILSGVGFGWVPEHLLVDDMARGELVPVQLVEGDSYTYQPSLARREGRPPGRTCALVVDALAGPGELPTR
jgi:DNA-binding transcriptional LysR family regulator